MASFLALKYSLRILFHQFNQLVTKEIPDAFHLRNLPPEPMKAAMAFRSNSKFSCTACAHLAQWIEKSNYKIKENESSREIYLPLSPDQNAQFVEIQIPIIVDN